MFLYLSHHRRGGRVIAPSRFQWSCKGIFFDDILTSSESIFFSVKKDDLTKDIYVYIQRPCKDSFIKPICLMFVKSMNDARGLDDLRNVQVIEFEKIFTHNKIFIFDCEIVMIGSFNVAEESLHADGNYEFGMVVKSPKSANSYCEWWTDRNVIINSYTACLS